MSNGPKDPAPSTTVMSGDTTPKVGERVCIMRGAWEELRGTWAVVVKRILHYRDPTVLVLAPEAWPGRWIALCEDEVGRA